MTTIPGLINGLFFLVLLEGAHEGSLVLWGLEATVAELGGGVDELQAHLLHGNPLGLDDQGLSQSKDPLLWPNAAALDHDEVLFDFTVVREAAHGVDGFVGQIVLGAGVVLDQLSVLHGEACAHSVDLLVDLAPVVVALLSSPGHGGLDSAGMPGTDTGNLAQTLVSLPGQLLTMPTAGHALESVSLGDTNDVQSFVHGEDLSHGDLLLEVFPGPVDLVCNGSSVELDLHDVSLLLSAAEELHLGVDDDPHGGAVLLDLVQVLLNLLLAKIISPFGAALGEGLLLGLRPVLVEPPLGFLANVLSPDSFEGSEAAGSLDVSDQTDAHHGRGLDDGDSLHNFLLVDLGARPLDLSDDVGHTGLVAHEGGHVDGLARVILGEGLYFAANALGTLLGKESLRPVTGCLKLTMRHFNDSLVEVNQAILAWSF